ncbi:hypothetical protein [Bacillus sp. 1P02SD]
MRKTMKIEVAKKVLEGNQKGKIFLTNEGRKVLLKVVERKG